MASEEVLYIDGGHRLKGETWLQGSKNAALPMIAASLLAVEGKTVLHRVPPVKDVLVALEVLRWLGAKVDFDAEEGVAVIDATTVKETSLPSDLTDRFRASLLFVGPLLARFRKAEIREVGGCSIGQRPWDIHHRGFARLGASVESKPGGGISVTADRLKGAFTYCDVPSHTGTENLIMAGSLASGTSQIENAASDPEIVDFVELLKKMGAKVEGAGTRTVNITGVKKLTGAEHTVMYDRLDAGLFMMASAITGGDVAIRGVCSDHLRVFESKLHQMGVQMVQKGEMTRVRGPEELSPINIITTFYPGFPTDLQPGIMALACVAHGESYIRETVFEDRFGHVKNLRAFGATLTPEKDRLIIVKGSARLTGAKVKALDIRAGAACVLAGLKAEGRTGISSLYQLDRGHFRIEERLNGLGAKLERI